ncbi:cupin domain-containing protein [Mycolicibacterium farcinogenes]|uniref:cupin domain-containing protein n=1 Tax=Mycolicibacterium farcinogenes TaxID=1802 RepID=UPI001C8D91C4|nr:cupin domain-containing protein [Mycolicibacterium farcinogenes]QZH62363.1 cupin domain-containing protein [Mycolicibacterium farcinogenes]
MPTLIHLSKAVVRGELTPAGQRPGADCGDPQLKTLPVESGTDAQVGVWECQPGGWPVVNRPNTETCYIVAGRARLTDEATGQVVEIGAGDFITLPPGWSGRWDVIETVRKVYAIF